MTLSLLLLLAAPADGSLATFRLPPGNRLALAAAATPPDKASRYRVAQASGARASSKDRAVANDGSYCNVVGAKRCTHRGRKVFSTDFTD